MLETITKENFTILLNRLEAVGYIISGREPFYNNDFGLISQDDFDKKYKEFYSEENKTISLSWVMYNNLTEKQRERKERYGEDIKISFTQIIFNTRIISKEKLDIKFGFNN